jgi:transcriptional regulator with XRE-family HTH domain
VSNHDLSVFTEDNARWKANNKRVSWNERVRLIEKQFPSAGNADWNIILRDNDVFGRIIKDILKVDQLEPGRAGPRPNLDYERGMQSWRELTGQDYCEQPFTDAFRWLTRRDSYTQMARKTNISKTRLFKLAHGHVEPTIEDLRDIAAAYGKKAPFFAEYRAEYIVAHIAARLRSETEMTVALYSKLVHT